MRDRSRRILLVMLLLGLVGSAGSAGTLSAFSSTTVNAGNVFRAGTVLLSDNDGGVTPMFNVTNAKPTYSETHCIRLTYGGSLDAAVKIYTASSIGAVGQYVTMTITQGTEASSTFPTCQAGFTAFGSNPVFSGKLCCTAGSFASQYTGFATGLALLPGAAATKWTGGANEAVVYKFVLSLDDNNAANGAGSGQLSTGSFDITWEAQNL